MGCLGSGKGRSVNIIQTEFGHWEGFRFITTPMVDVSGTQPSKPPAACPWLLPDGCAVLERRPLPLFKRTFLHLMLLRAHSSDLWRWM